MDNDKDLKFEGEAEGGETIDPNSAPRARNKTVMLSPDVTGQVRARLASELQQSQLGTPGTPAQPATPAATGGGGFSGGNPLSARPAPPRGKPTSGVFLNGGEKAPAPGQPSVPAAAAPVGGAPSVPGAVVAPDGSGQTVGAYFHKESPIVGFLVSFDASPYGEVIDLRVGRVIVTSEGEAKGDFIIINDESVSPSHAIMRITEEGRVQVLDQLSEHGTKVEKFNSNKVEELSGDKAEVEHGDVVKFGKRAFTLCMIPKKKASKAKNKE